jgi:hypothetical protein
MRAFLDYLLAFGRRTSRPAALLTIFLLAALITVNYTVGIERRILGLGLWYVVYGSFVAFYSAVIALAWGLQYEWSGSGRPVFSTGLVRLLVIAPLFFAAKMVHWNFSALLPGSQDSPLNRYWTVVTQLPAKFLLLGVMLWGCWKAGWLEGNGFTSSVGLTKKGVSAQPYFMLLLLLVPLVVLASTQHDFLRIYPKVKSLAFMNTYPGPVWPWKAGYELSYGIDFLSIELFFRGLLVIGIVRYAGEQAILPMAAFYCTIHFGKPLGECITSFFGGLVLGVLAYRTRSILGGLIVHLGLAWMMELGGWVGGG